MSALSSTSTWHRWKNVTTALNPVSIFGGKQELCLTAICYIYDPLWLPQEAAIYCSKHLKTIIATTTAPKTTDCCTARQQTVALQEAARCIQDQPPSTLDGFMAYKFFPSCFHDPLASLPLTLRERTLGRRWAACLKKKGMHIIIHIYIYLVHDNYANMRWVFGLHKCGARYSVLRRHLH